MKVKITSRFVGDRHMTGLIVALKTARIRKTARYLISLASVTEQ